MHAHAKRHTWLHTPRTHTHAQAHTSMCTYTKFLTLNISIRHDVSSLLGSMTLPGGHLTHSTRLSKWVTYIVKPHNASTSVIFLVMWRSCPSLLKSGWSVICRRTITSPASMSGCKHQVMKIISHTQKNPCSKTHNLICLISKWYLLFMFHSFIYGNLLK